MVDLALSVAAGGMAFATSPRFECTPPGSFWSRSLTAHPPIKRLLRIGGGSPSAKRAPSLFQSPDLLSRWADHFATGRRRSVRYNRCQAEWTAADDLAASHRAASHWCGSPCGAGAPIGQYDEILLDPDCDGSEALAAAAGPSRARPDRISILLGTGARRRTRSTACLRTRPARPARRARPMPTSRAACRTSRRALKSRVARQQRKRMRRFEQEGRVAFEVATDPDRRKAGFPRRWR